VRPRTLWWVAVDKATQRVGRTGRRHRGGDGPLGSVTSGSEEPADEFADQSADHRADHYA
jgi:hypothetical protein